MADYKHPEVLVSTEWVAENLTAPNTRLVEVDVDTTAYAQGHIPGAVGWNWQTQLQDNIRRDLIDRSALEALLGKSGITNDTTVLLYGDNNNWFAAYAFWQLKYYGHKDVRLINGGRKKWLEEKRATTTEPASVAHTTYKASDIDESIRARREEVLRPLVDSWRQDPVVRRSEAQMDPPGAFTLPSDALTWAVIGGIEMPATVTLRRGARVTRPAKLRTRMRPCSARSPWRGS